MFPIIRLDRKKILKSCRRVCEWTFFSFIKSDPYLLKSTTNEVAGPAVPLGGESAPHFTLKIKCYYYLSGSLLIRNEIEYLLSGRLGCVIMVICSWWINNINFGRNIQLLGRLCDQWWRRKPIPGKTFRYVTLLWQEKGRGWSKERKGLHSEGMKDIWKKRKERRS